MGQKVIFKVPLSINSVLEAEKSSTQHWHILNMIKTYKGQNPSDGRGIFLVVSEMRRDS